jgi:hypothetical protein
VLLGIVACLGLGTAIGVSPILYFGSRAALRAWFVGHPVFGEFLPGDLTVRKGEKLQISAYVWNFTAHPIDILGVKSSCGCIQLEHRPDVLPPRQRTPIVFNLSADRTGEWTFETDIYLGNTHDNRSCPLRLNVTIK